MRLLKGDFSQITHYEKTPVDQANDFFKLGFKNIHIVDLDGVLEGQIVNRDIIREIAKENNIKIQFGGGIRSLEDIKNLLSMGIDKVIVGTSAIENVDFLKKACEKFKDKIALSLDVRNGYIALSGWKKQTDILASEFIKKIKFFGVSRIIYTDINRDGTKTGPNLEETLNISKLTNIPVVVSGGVSSIQDIKNIKKKFTNIYGVIIGKAIYDGNINVHDLAEITKC